MDPMRPTDARTAALAIRNGCQPPMTGLMSASRDQEAQTHEH